MSENGEELVEEEFIWGIVEKYFMRREQGNGFRICECFGQREEEREVV